MFWDCATETTNEYIFRGISNFLNGIENPFRPLRVLRTAGWNETQGFGVMR